MSTSSMPRFSPAAMASTLGLRYFNVFGPRQDPDRTTLNGLYAELLRLLAPKFPRLRDASPIYRAFRDGDVRQADVGKAVRLLGYAPTDRIGRGLELAMPWYVGSVLSMSRRRD